MKKIKNIISRLFWGGVLIGLVSLIGVFCIFGIQYLNKSIDKSMIETKNSILQKAAEKGDKGQPLGKVKLINSGELEDKAFFSGTGSFITTDKEIFTIQDIITHMQLNIEAYRFVDGDKNINIICFGSSPETITKTDCYFEYKG